MLLHVGKLSVFLITNMTSVWLLPGMDPLVLREIGLLGECLVAGRAPGINGKSKTLPTAFSWELRMSPTDL